ncbi:BaeS Signal transduction histidine kinase [Rhabdaerophilaceae bacterium]
MTSLKPKPPLSARELTEIAHELRSPLGGFEAMLTLLHTTSLTAEQRDLVDALGASAAHLRGILGRILPAHPGETQPEIRLAALINAIATSTRARADARGLAFHLQIDEGIEDTLVLDAMPLRQVLENLIDNAVRATARGEVILQVSSVPAGRIAFSLCDTGTGLPAEIARRLHAAQLAGPIAVEAASPQSGLGLGIAARLVARHGGTLQATVSGDGEGTCFQFDWPSVRSSGQGESTRMLIVDDHPASRLVLRTVLNAMGFATLEAENGLAALEILLKYRVSAVWSDLCMPNGNGHDLIRFVTTLPEGQRPRLIVVSADDPREDTSFHAPVDEVVLKPISVPAIVRALEETGFGRIRAA